MVALDTAHIAEYGYGIQGVVGPGGLNDGFGSWAYTVGLLDRAAHPELIVAGLPPSDGSSLLSVLAGSVLAGERYQVGETIDLGEGIATVGAVHDLQYEIGTFSTWYRLREVGVFQVEELAAVQIRLPAVYFPSGRDSLQPVLAERDARVEAPD